MATTQIAVFEGPGRPFRFAEHRLPEADSLAAGEVLVAISVATLCGSDLHTLEGRRQEPSPSILGHEGVGRVVAKGFGRDDLRLGERVTWSMADSCGCCVACRDWELPQKCRKLFKYGHALLSVPPGLHGCYASHIVLRAGTEVVPVPDEVPDTVAAPVNCALATMIAVTKRIPEGVKSVVIQGAGLLGLYGCALLRVRGVPRVTLVDRNPVRLELAAAFGGEPALGSALGVIGAGTADAVVEVTGDAGVLAEGMQLVRPGGQYVWAGMVHPESRVDLTGEAVIRKCLEIRGVHNYTPRDLREAVRFLSANLGKFPWERLVSAPVPLRDLNEAFRRAAEGKWARVSVTPLPLR